jgi:hypothetical protein
MPKPFFLATKLQGRVKEVMDGLLRPATLDADRGAAFAEARASLETLPLTTEEFSLAVNRLANAQRYLESGEHGAARWELLQLRRILRS